MQTTRCNVFLVAVLISSAANGQTNDAPRTRPLHPLRVAGSKPVEPFRVIGNIYYVGAVGISSHIITTDQGLILLDTGTDQMQTGILSNIEKLGFRWQDIKVILSSHAHWDHVEGHAEMRAMTGAQVMALGEDAAAIATGVDNSAIGAAGWSATQIDRVLHDGDLVSLGDVTLRAHLTAGHTKGCTTWTTTVRDGPAEHTVVFIGGTSVNQGVRLVENARHPGIADDYVRTFRTLKGLKPDVFLAQHPAMYSMAEKRQRMIAGAARNPFIDPDGYQHFVRVEEAKFVIQLQQDSADR